ncbi:30S ribosomal protein S6e [Candidatus Micrarchaeota archaeon]|nr:30S ribosomal protein S6e [Candidatus Micrarchaeota archaeon]
MKVVIGNKDGKSYQVEVPQENIGTLMGKKIGDTIEGSQIGVTGYSFKITGGSDLSGFPMRYDVEGSGKQKVLMSKGPGFKKKSAGERRKKMIHGKQIGQDVNQINVIVTKEGPTSLGKLFGKEEAPKEATEEKQ